MERLGKNLGSYLGEVINVEEVLADCTAAGREHGWTIEEIPARPGLNLIAFTRRAALPDASHTTPRIYISAGIHGDEPAGTLAALRMLRENQWPANLDLWLLPCLNPTGFPLNRRENDKGIDLNRQYLHLEADETRAHVAWLEKQPDFDLCLCLHEDWESQGFYLYELNLGNRPSLAEPIVAAVRKVCPVDQSEIIEGRPA